MLFNRKSAGVSISSSGIDVALLGGKRTQPVLERVASRPFNDAVVRVSLREPNIVDPERFITALKEAVNLTIYKGKNIFLSLPDGAGRVMLMDMESRFKSRAEGLDTIRWKLKKSLPIDLADTHLDYQLLQVRESGELLLLVAVTSKTVISQYEEIITAAGFNPTRIELEAFSICRCFNRQLEIMGDGGLIYIYNNTIGIMVFVDGLPVFSRFKTIPESISPQGRIRGEISNSLLAYRERFPDQPLKKLSCLISPEVSRDFCDLLEDISGLKPTPLDTIAAIKPSTDSPSDHSALFRSTVAIGAAMRGL